MCNNDENYVFVERYHNKPILTLEASNTTAVVGGNATMRCGFVSDLNPYVYWLKGNMSDPPTTPAEDKKVHTDCVHFVIILTRNDLAEFLFFLYCRCYFVCPDNTLYFV